MAATAPHAKGVGLGFPASPLPICVVNRSHFPAMHKSAACISHDRIRGVKKGGEGTRFIDICQYIFRFAGEREESRIRNPRSFRQLERSRNVSLFVPPCGGSWGLGMRFQSFESCLTLGLGMRLERGGTWVRCSGGDGEACWYCGGAEVKSMAEEPAQPARQGKARAGLLSIGIPELSNLIDGMGDRILFALLCLDWASNTCPCVGVSVWKSQSL